MCEALGGDSGLGKARNGWKEGGNWSDGAALEPFLIFYNCSKFHN